MERRALEWQTTLGNKAAPFWVPFFLRKGNDVLWLIGNGIATIASLFL
ncbi:hypothetical protein [Endozoicomonas euniceicola]|uniref:Uncharacterized protein n=1 Tax=Endozoicomonas euniceicola TaxID=1234143 RepID=A0ABY6GQY2_9GAMM|nr:hypothetical protein [Endozoicomonas euniceicola]UYM14972.1 hypothetical protein NX720_19075 [Endozoicomonas euniceicola]